MADYDSNKQIHNLERYDTTLTKNSLVLSQDTLGNRLGSSEFIDLLNTVTLDDIQDGVNYQKLDEAAVQAYVNAAIISDTDIAKTTEGLDQFADTTSTELRGIITDSSGSGSLVFNNSPSFTTPDIGVATGVSFNGITGLSNITPVMDGVATPGVGTAASRSDHVHPFNIALLSDSNPLMNGTASPGTSGSISRNDHVHPSDTAKQSISGKDVSNGYAGLTLLKINFMNVLGTIKSFFTNSNTVARTYTFQDRDGTIADNTDITNVTNYVDNLVADPVNKISALGSISGSYAIDVSTYDTFTATITGSTTLSFNNFVDGRTISLILTNGGTNITWPATVKWPGGTIAVLSTSGTDRIVLQKISSTITHANLAGKAYA